MAVANHLKTNIQNLQRDFLPQIHNFGPMTTKLGQKRDLVVLRKP